MTDASPERLADAREHAIRVLTDRYADDTLSSGEFEGRLDQLYGTATPAAAHALVADLLVARPLASTRQPPLRPAPAYAPPQAYEPPGGHEVVLCVLGQRDHVARADRVGYLSVRAILGSVTLDLRDTPPGTTRDLDLQLLFAEVRVLLPADAIVEVDVNPVLGNVTDETALARSPRGGARIRLRGTSAFAELSLRRAPDGVPAGLRFRDLWKEAGRAVRMARKALRARGYR